MLRKRISQELAANIERYIEEHIRTCVEADFPKEHEYIRQAKLAELPVCASEKASSFSVARIKSICTDRNEDEEQQNAEINSEEMVFRNEECFDTVVADKLACKNICERKIDAKKRSLNDLIRERDFTFSESLLKIIDRKGLSDSSVYKRANIDRKLFSKIRSDRDYKPSKNTAIALAIALELSLDEVLDLIGRAGFTLSMSGKFDLIIRYFLEQANFNILDINEALFAFDQPIIGGWTNN